MKLLTMALNIIYSLYFVTAPDATNFPLWAANTKLKIYWDDSANAMAPKLYNGLDALIDTPLTGPNLTASWTALNTRVTDYKFQYCVGTTLNYFTLDLNIYPYANRQQVANSNICQTIVCDLTLVNVATVPATGLLNTDGSATVNATTGHPVMKYKLNAVEFDYASDGQVSNIFTGLLPGTFTFCIKDSYLCKKTGSFVIGNIDTYVERWRSDFKELKTNILHSIRIEDRLFVGNYANIKMDISAAQVSWRGESVEDSFNPVVPSQLTALLFSETDGQFVDLFTGDERRFKLKKYIDTGTGAQLQWVGFITPMLYSEPYTESSNYSINVVATDQIGNLSKFQFVNDQNIPFVARISYLEAICTILRKTGLQLNIKESINLFETTMAQTASDCMLSQCTIDPDTYKNDDGTMQDSLTVLKSLIANLGSRLYMDNGIWNIDFVEQKSSTSIPYRVFNYLGVYQSNASYDPTIVFGTSYINNRIVPINSNLFMNITQNYGTFIFIYDMHIDNNFLWGGDIEDNTGSAPTIKGWSVDITQGSGISYGLEKLDSPNKKSNFAAYFDFKNSQSGAYVILQSDSFTYTVVTLAKFQLLFDLYTRPLSSNSYIFIDYEVRMGNGAMYLNNEQTLIDGQRNITSTPGPLLGSVTNYATNPEFNRVYITENLTWKTIQVNFTGSEIAMNGAAYVKFRISGNAYADYPTIAAMIAAPTLDGRILAQAPKARVFDQAIGAGAILRFYTLNWGPDATSFPDKIRPNDWNTGAPVFWRLDKTSTVPANVLSGSGPFNWLQSILIDNIKLAYLPGVTPGGPPIGRPFGTPQLNTPLPTPQIKITLINVSNPNIFNTLNKTFNHGDLPFTPTLDQNGNPILDAKGNVVYSTTADVNYKYIAKGHLELINGTPTANWKRSYISTDNLPLIQLLQNLYMGQFQAPKLKLSGMFGYDLPVSFSNTFNEIRTGKRYLPNAMTLNYADSSMTCEMLELKQGISSPAPDLFAFSLGHSPGFNA